MPSSRTRTAAKRRPRQKVYCILNEECERYLAQTFYLVEADSFAQHALWSQHAANSIFPPWDKRNNCRAFAPVQWNQLNPGGIVTVGHIKEMPVALELCFAQIEGRIVCFWHMSSVVTDSRMAEAWLENHFNGVDSDGRRVVTDANNFGHCLAAIEHANNAAAAVWALMIERLDNWLADRAQSTANRIQDWTGITCYTLALGCLGMSALIEAVKWSLYEWRAIAVALSLINVFIYSWIMQTTWNARGEGMNPFRVNGFGYRLIFLFFTVAYLFSYLVLLLGDVRECEQEGYNVAAQAAFTVALYLGSCTPKPPKRREEWSWRDLFMTHPASAEN